MELVCQFTPSDLLIGYSLVFIAKGVAGLISEFVTNQTPFCQSADYGAWLTPFLSLGLRRFSRRQSCLTVNLVLDIVMLQFFINHYIEAKWTCPFGIRTQPHPTLPTLIAHAYKLSSFLPRDKRPPVLSICVYRSRSLSRMQRCTQSFHKRPTQWMAVLCLTVEGSWHVTPGYQHQATVLSRIWRCYQV